MRLLHIIAALAFSSAIATPSVVFAQGAAPSSSQVQTAVHSALQAADLTMHQKMQIKPMIEQYQQQTANADDATKKSAKQQLLKSIYGVMTPDQQAKFKASLKSSLGAGAAP
jgi:hypothetical protein